MIYLKKGVRLHGIRPELVLALGIADQVYADLDYATVVTSVIDGKHMRTSLHYTGGAFDIRVTKNHGEALRQRIAHALGEDFDVVLEEAHIHVEWQPKEPY